MTINTDLGPPFFDIASKTERGYNIKETEMDEAVNEASRYLRKRIPEIGKKEVTRIINYKECQIAVCLPSKINSVCKELPIRVSARIQCVTPSDETRIFAERIANTIILNKEERNLLSAGLKKKTSSEETEEEKVQNAYSGVSICYYDRNVSTCYHIGVIME